MRSHAVVAGSDQHLGGPWSSCGVPKQPVADDISALDAPCGEWKVPQPAACVQNAVQNVVRCSGLAFSGCVTAKSNSPCALYWTVQDGARRRVGNHRDCQR